MSTPNEIGLLGKTVSPYFGRLIWVFNYSLKYSQFNLLNVLNI
ncbi:hypothetical protein GMMP15_1500007 [Candidatus Magnetomoraceae bacterium gMMP-15]